MKRDKVINYSSKTATNDTILNTIVNNSDADKNLLAGEIAVVMTSDNEALYTLNHNKTALIEYKPYYKIKAYIDEQTAGVMKNEEVTITFASNVGNIPSNAKAIITFKDEGIETLYFRNEKGDGLLEFIEKNSIVDLINEKLANKVHSIIGEKCINSVEDKDDEGNKIVRLSVKMDDNVANRATINDKGLFVSNITDCGAF